MVGRRAAAGLASAWRSPYARAAVGAASRLRPRLAPEGAILILLVMVVGTFSIEAISPFDPLVGQPRERLQGPEWAWDFWNVHILGTDQQGRDVFVRLLVGARFSLLVAALTVGIAGFVGLALGMVAGYYRGAVEAVLMRLTDAVLALPIILLALVLGVVYRRSITLVIIALSANLWAGYARMIRGETLSVMNRDFIRLARVAGAGPVRIIVHHIFPHVKNTFIVLLTLQFGVAILAESSLSFLGAGIPPPDPSWGSMASQGRQYIETAWWVTVFPGLAILLVVLSFNTMGDWIRDKLDPNLQQ